MDHTTTFTIQIHTCAHCQSGLTALKVAQSEAHRDVCDILLQYSQQGAKVSSAEQAESNSRKEEETKAELAEVGMMTTGDERQGNLSASLLFRSRERVIPRERVQRSSLERKGQMIITKDLQR